MKAPVTKILLFTNIFIWLSMYFLGYILKYASVETIEYTRNFLDSLYLMPISFLNGSWWQVFTSMFIHGPWWHITFNMLALWSIGTPIELTIGSRDFAFLYFISGLASAIMVLLLSSPLSQTVGASGAIIGMLGAMAVFYPDAKLLVFFLPLKAKTAAVILLALSFFFAFYDTLTPFSHAGHFGGLLGGLFFSKFLSITKSYSGIMKELKHNRKKQTLAANHKELSNLQDETNNSENTKPEWNEFDSLKVFEKRVQNWDSVKLSSENIENTEQNIYYDPVEGKYYTKD